MLQFILILIGIMSIASIIINYICDIYFGNAILMRINQFLMYGVACLLGIAIYLYRENEMIVSIAVVAFIISIIKSFVYYKVYIKMYNWAEEDETDKEENNNETEEN